MPIAPLISALITLASGSSPARSSTTPGLDILASCAAGENPFYASTALQAHWIVDPFSLLAFNDLPTEDVALNVKEHIELATRSSTGSLYGLAYDWTRRDLYAGAYHKCGTVPSPAGLGAIYQVHIASGAVRQWALMDAGHAGSGSDGGTCDVALIGKVGLGDLEIDPLGRRLFAMNLFDQRIHVFSLPDGMEITSFPHGASAANWASNARPFALGVHGDWLYQGIVDSREDAKQPGSLSGHIYRSRWNGGGLEEMISFDLNYPRQPPWRPWNQSEPIDRKLMSQAILADIEFRPDGMPILGLRDRMNDLMPGREPYNGDILAVGTASTSTSWEVLTDQDHFDDTVITYEWQDPITEGMDGALAAIPNRDGVVASSVLKYWSGGAVWFDAATGAKVGPANKVEYLFGEDTSGGDIESLCGPGGQVYLPSVSRDTCLRSNKVAVALVLDISTSMEQPSGAGRPKSEAALEAAKRFIARLHFGTATRESDQVAVIGFNDTAWIEQPVSHDASHILDALLRLGSHRHEGTRLDLALQRAGDALQGADGSSSRTRAVILLTDGLPNRVPFPAGSSQEATVLATATALKRLGAEIYTVGLGRPGQFNEALLREVATKPGYYHNAEDAESLASIYDGIAATMTCRQ